MEGMDSLNKNQIGDVGAQAIAEALEVNTKLTHLYLTKNQIGDVGAQAIAEALKVNTTLTTLSLNHNQLGEGGAQAIAEALKANTTLTKLYLHTNQIGDVGAHAIAEALKVNKTLTTLCLSQNFLTNPGINALRQTGSTTCNLDPIYGSLDQQRFSPHANWAQIAARAAAHTQPKPSVNLATENQQLRSKLKLAAQKHVLAAKDQALVTKDQELATNKQELTTRQALAAKGQEPQQLRLDLAAKDQKFATTEQELVAKDQQLAVKDQELTAKDQALATNKQKLTTRERELATKDQALAAKDQELATRDQALAAKEQELQQLRLDLAAKDQKLATTEQELVAKDQQLAIKDQELTAKDQEIAANKQKLTTREQELATKDQALAAKDQALAAKDQELATRDQALAAKDQELQQLRFDLAAKDQKLATTDQELAAKVQDLQQLRSNLVAKDQELATKDRELKSALDRIKRDGPLSNFDGPIAQVPLATLISATNSFAADSLVGEGAFGRVYSARLPGPPVAVAIKKLSAVSIQHYAAFQSELKSLSKFRHTNIIAMLSYAEAQGEYCLVYEFMPNGSVRDRLNRKNDTLPLTWSQRHHIAADVSRGMHYVQTAFSDHVLFHLDLKTDNVLLDAHFNAKVSDFGLVRAAEHLDDKSSLRTKVPQGTAAYMCPEFLVDGRMTVKTDVYAFGMILIELVTAAKPGNRLKLDARRAVKNQTIVGMLDSALNPTEAEQQSISEIVTLALECLDDEAADRPSFGQLIVQLDP
ncbi:hypothetical protein CAOG_06176 [Capsaspora owczarzaki ATCC 30864]|uniref:hypothetical protein n=1 Tax=Capsaspora owczarzaki (strain ATCC 30864) TaxID=595528 RepID=UPI0003521F84|nr:hypothetical protein CAOG_06176 [Capsaspora owczarzaki ATCC 30864]|eukprot:XP_004345766.2 hypothetical protein CAOG_06176 [Capsaspora owczarzaki ATCC 30864]